MDRGRQSELQQTVRSPSSLGGTISVPGDKSISHRALILNSIAQGDARITGLSSGADVLSTMRCLTGLGAEITLGPEPGTT